MGFGEPPLEWCGDLLVVVLELQQSGFEFAESVEVVGRKHLSLYDREVDQGKWRSDQSNTEARVAEAFNAYFVNFSVRIAPEDVVIGTRGTTMSATSKEGLAYHLPR